MNTNAGATGPPPQSQAGLSDRGLNLWVRAGDDLGREEESKMWFRHTPSVPSSRQPGAGRLQGSGVSTARERVRDGVTGPDTHFEV